MAEPVQRNSGQLGTVSFSINATISSSLGKYKVRPHELNHSTESIAVNSKYFVLPWQGPERASTALGVVDQLVGSGYLDQVHVPILEAKSRVSSFEFNPFHDDILASASEDNLVRVWRLDQILSRESPSACIKDSTRSYRDPSSGRPSHVLFHPCAAGMLTAAVGMAGDFRPPGLNMYDIGDSREDHMLHVTLKEPSLSLNWTYDGSLLLVVGASSRKLFAVDPRVKDGIAISSEPTHQKPGKPVKVLALREDDRAMTIGHTRMGMREFRLWDLRNLSGCLNSTVIERENTSSPHAALLDVESHHLFFSTRGERDIHLWKIDTAGTESFSLVDSFRALQPVPMQSLAMLPKSTCSFGSGEFARLARLCGEELDVIQFTVEIAEQILPAQTAPFLLLGDIPVKPMKQGQVESTDASELQVTSLAAELFPDNRVRSPVLTSGEWAFLNHNGWPNISPNSAGGPVAADLSRFLGSEEFSDFSIRESGGETIIPIHKCVVCARCPALNTLIRDACFSGRDHIVLDYSRTCINALLQWIYTDSLPRFEFAAAAKGLFELADKLQLPQLLRMLSRQPRVASLAIPELQQLQGTLNDVSSSYLVDMNNLMENASNFFPDFEFVCADRVFSAHRIIVASRSKFFYRVLTSGFSEQAEGKLLLRDLNSVDLSAILATMYIGKATRFISPDNVIDVWLSATQHELSELIRICERFIQDSVDVENAVPLLVRAELVDSSSNLQMYLLNYITTHFDEILADPEKLNELPPKFLAAINERRPVKASRLRLFK